jgi:cell wall-associated NlpC family hydrolase
MPQPNKIRTAAKEKRVRELAAQGLTYRQISDALKQEGFSVSHVAVGRFLAEETNERRAAARSVASTEAKESVPLVTAALRQLVVMNMTAAKKAYRGGGTDSAPNPDISALADATRAAVAAAKALHSTTVGDEPGNSADDLRGEVLGILAARNKRVESEE